MIKTDEQMRQEFERAEGYDGTSIQKNEKTPQQKEALLRSFVIDKYHQLFEGMKTEERSAVISKLVEKERADWEKGIMTPSEERDFASWVTEKMNAGEPLPDDAGARLNQYREEMSKKSEHAA